MNIRVFDGDALLVNLEASINVFEGGNDTVLTSLVGIVDPTRSNPASGTHNVNNGAYIDLDATTPSNIKLYEVKSPDTFTTVKAKGIADGNTFSFFAPQVYVSDTLTDVIAFRAKIPAAPSST